MNDKQRKAFFAGAKRYDESEKGKKELEHYNRDVTEDPEESTDEYRNRNYKIASESTLRNN